jgi:hypothetical protein
MTMSKAFVLAGFAILALSISSVKAQGGLAVAMYVPHDLNTTAASATSWEGTFEAPLTVTWQGRADWAAFCVNADDATCFSEPVSDIVGGDYTAAKETIAFNVTGIPSGQDVVCYVATVLPKGMVCSKPVLDYTVLGPVNDGNNNWLHNRAGQAIGPVVSKLNEAAKETVQMVQETFGELQGDAASEIESAIQVIQTLAAPSAEPAAEPLVDQLAAEFDAIAEAIRPDATTEEPVEVYGSAVVTEIPVPEPSAELPPLDPVPMPSLKDLEPQLLLGAELDDDFVLVDSMAIEQEPAVKEVVSGIAMDAELPDDFALEDDAMLL